MTRILTHDTKVTRDNIAAVYGLSPLVPTLLLLVSEQDARIDLNVGLLVAGSVASALSAIVLHGIVWLQTGVRFLSTWFEWGELPARTLFKRLLAASFLSLWPFAILMFVDPGEARCTTEPCRGAAFMVGSNLSSVAAMWLISGFSGFALSLSVTNAVELVRRIVCGKGQVR